MPVTPDEHRAALLGAGVPAWPAERLAELARHAYAPRVRAATTDTVERVLGRPPTSWDAVLAEHAAVLQAT